METMMMVAVGLASANSIILLVLLFVYSKIVLKTKAMYAAGLLIFAVLLLAHNLLTISAYVLMAPVFEAEAMPFPLGISALELGGLAVLVKITL